jgi:aminoglycoside phosphotransferase (APT) family kinase protein
MSLPSDQTAPVREGEALDVEKLSAYLAGALPEFAGTVDIEQFPGGHSNLTYCLRSGEREWVLRRPPFGSKVKSAHDMGREYTVLSHLHEAFGPAPRPVLHCEDLDVIGAPFYVMERVRGTIFRNAPPKGVRLSEDDARICCETLVDTLAELHAIDYRAVGLDSLRKSGQYTERQVTGWIKRYAGSQTDDIADVDATAKWLEARIPEDCGAVVVHNDFKFDNIVFDPDDLGRIVGVLDWEMATIGDPLMDLGTSLGYWTDGGDHGALRAVTCFLTSLPGALTRQEVAVRYLEKTGREETDLLFYYVFALLKVAVIVQQIYYRYQQGLTKDPRFAAMIGMVKLLAAQAVRAIEQKAV